GRRRPANDPRDGDMLCHRAQDIEIRALRDPRTISALGRLSLRGEITPQLEAGREVHKICTEYDWACERRRSAPSPSVMRSSRGSGDAFLDKRTLKRARNAEKRNDRLHECFRGYPPQLVDRPA